MIRLFLLLTLFFAVVSCTQGADYYTINPSANGVLLDGESNNNISGYKTATGSLSSPASSAGVSNTIFFTINGNFVIDNTKPAENSPSGNNDFALEVKNTGFDTYYMYYRDKNNNLARDTVNYTNGVNIVSGNDPMFYIKNSKFEDITAKGLINVGSNAQFTLYFQLTSPQDLSGFSTCYGYFDKSTNSLITPNCFESWVDGVTNQAKTKGEDSKTTPANNKKEGESK